MSVYWHMRVTSEAGIARDTITVDDAIASLDSFSVDRAGNCQEATFTALPTAVDIQPRDTIQLRIWWADSYWADLWKGTVVQAGSPRSHNVQSYRAVGLKQRFYEVVLREGVISGGDVASMAYEAAATATASIRGIVLPAYFSVVGFELGDRFPGLETIGAFLDALAASVGAFTVPAGESYTYAGVTYDAGELVPAVMWGVDAGGAVFFKRPQAAALELSEADAGTRVTWTETNAEEYVNSVTLAYLAEVQSERLTAWGSKAGANEQTETLAVVPLSRTFTSADAAEEASAVVALSAPLDYMGKRTPTALVQFGTCNDLANSRDGNLSTFATLASGTSVSYSAGARGPCLWRVRLAWYSGFDITIRATLLGWSGGETAANEYAYTINGADGESGGEPVDLWLPCLQLAHTEFTSTPTASLSIYAVQNEPSDLPEVYEVEYYLPDCDTGVPGSASASLAGAFLRPVPSGVAAIELFDLPNITGVTQSVTLTTLSGEEVGLDVERIEYGLTTAEGGVVRYHIGQAYQSDLVSQRVVLERLAKRANAAVLS